MYNIDRFIFTVYLCILTSGALCAQYIYIFHFHSVDVAVRASNSRQLYNAPSLLLHPRYHNSTTQCFFTTIAAQISHTHQNMDLIIGNTLEVKTTSPAQSNQTRHNDMVELLTLSLWDQWHKLEVDISHCPENGADTTEYKSNIERMLQYGSRCRQSFTDFKTQVLNKYSSYDHVPTSTKDLDPVQDISRYLTRTSESYAIVWAIAHYAHENRLEPFWADNYRFYLTIEMEKVDLESAVCEMLNIKTIFLSQKADSSLAAAEICRLEQALEDQKAMSDQASAESRSLKEALENQKADSSLAAAEIRRLEQALEDQKAMSDQASAESRSLKEALENQKAESTPALADPFRDILTSVKATVQEMNAAADREGLSRDMIITAYKNVSTQHLEIIKRLEKACQDIGNEVLTCRRQHASN